jgi:hypothetical protein
MLLMLLFFRRIAVTSEMREADGETHLVIFNQQRQDDRSPKILGPMFAAVSSKAKHDLHRSIRVSRLRNAPLG